MKEPQHHIIFGLKYVVQGMKIGYMVEEKRRIGANKNTIKIWIFGKN